MGRSPHLEHSHRPDDIAARLGAGARPSYLRDYVYGGIDGAVTTFAIVAGSMGAELSARIVLILGVANLLADGFSMAAANFVSSRSEIEQYRALRAMEERHVDAAPEGEREEVRQIFAAKGFQGEALDKAVEVITEQRERWIDTMMMEEHGLAQLARSPLAAGAATFAAFVVCGLVPILPFAFGLPATTGVATAATGLTFFAIGALRSRWSPNAWWATGAETCLIGLAAAAVAYAAGAMLKTVL